MRMNSLLSANTWREALAAAGLVLAPLAGLYCTAEATAQTPVIRSVADWRERIPDEHDRPRYKERWTHRGFEVVNDNIYVVATTSIDDARRAAAEATQAWQEVGQLADHFTQVHKKKDFGIGALQVFVDGEKQRDRDQPLTTLNVVGQKSNLVVHVNPGSPSLEQQASRVREATALAFLRTAELDLQYPAWVSEGIAGYIAEKGQTAEAIEQIQPQRTTANIGGKQWRSVRMQQDVLTPDKDEHKDAVARVRFLLEGDDSAHTPAFFAALRASSQDIGQNRMKENLVNKRQGEVQPPIASGRSDQLFVSLEKNFAKWQEDPLAGQPLVKPIDRISPELEVLRQELALVLKLQKRFSAVTKATQRTKVVTFKKETTYIGGLSKVALGVADPRDVYFDLTKSEEPWATRDADGSLLLSTNTRRLEELFGDDGRRFTRIRRGEKWVLSYKLDNKQAMIAWLEENPESPSRPEVKYDIIDTTKPTPAKPPEQPQAELGPPVSVPQPPASSQQLPAEPKAESAPASDKPIGEWRAKTVQPNQ